MTAPSSESTDVRSLPTCDASGHCAGRRAVLRGAAALGAVGLLSACGGGSNDTAAPAPPAGGSDTGGSTSGGTVLGPTSEVPVGGGKTFNDKVVVTQPTAGEYKAFSAVCTHSQCVIYQVSGGSITCGCHGSRFSDKDGSVQQGPAESPLEKMTVTVDGGNLKLA